MPNQDTKVLNLTIRTILAAVMNTSPSAYRGYNKSGHHVNLYAYSCLLSAVKGHHVQLGGITSTQPLNHIVQQYLKWLVGSVRTKRTWQLTLQTPVIFSFPGLSTNTWCIHKAVNRCGYMRGDIFAAEMVIRLTETQEVTADIFLSKS